LIFDNNEIYKPGTGNGMCGNKETGVIKTGSSGNN
jgi:hypothetical protein